MTTKKPTRRRFMAAAAATASIPVLASCGAAPAQARKDFRIRKSDAQWRRQLTRGEYRILREAGTERAFTSPLNDEKRDGVYTCAGCGNRLYSSAHKYESGTGWPAFYKPIDKGAVGTSVDYKIGYPRTEVHCADCGGHLGHIFGDGPRPTGKRHCINGLAMDFVAT
ncbi:peptide-methionine (R)-S-oxide reductase MsrB [Erythrobacter ani]|uniref:Peptide-methionine (R)-S-oxide reductase MsrB n=1 Tax=Erythrobacter ani TaxID=2827235 RepID=A0ABS6SK97_9SPHN|nr:peptide-methionine (R)-S-oxide reductase MsrB [Erythrobacter ani]MBV7265424.1 peptide-methionine (R)-S-oxide reductase MsrB [Erythrobacter ani]